MTFPAPLLDSLCHRGKRHRDRYLEQQTTEKIETEARDVDRIEYCTKCTHAVQGGLLGGHKSTPVQHKLILFPPACSSTLKTEVLPGSWRASTWEQTAPKKTACMVSQTVRYRKLPPPRVLRVCYQPGQATWRVGSNIYVGNVFGRGPAKPSFTVLLQVRVLKLIFLNNTCFALSTNCPSPNTIFLNLSHKNRTTLILAPTSIENWDKNTTIGLLLKSQNITCLPSIWKGRRNYRWNYQQNLSDYSHGKIYRKRPTIFAVVLFGSFHPLFR